MSLRRRIQTMRFLSTGFVLIGVLLTSGSCWCLSARSRGNKWRQSPQPSSEGDAQFSGTTGFYGRRRESHRGYKPPIISSSEDPPPPHFESWDDLLLTTARSGATFSSVPRFVEFCKNHRYFASHLTGGRATHIDNILKGGPGAGPLATTDTEGQIVRVLGAFAGLTAKPRHNHRDSSDAVFEHDDITWVSDLQEQLPIILDEFNRIAPTLPESCWESLGEYHGNDTGWSQITFFDNFRRREANLNLFPETARILSDVVGTERRLGPRHTAFARQKAGTGIPEHCDMMNWMLTLHTALLGPNEGCGIVVDGERKDWTVGAPSVMDTTFKHHTYNESDEDLYLLMIDFWHPDLSVDEIDGLRTFWALNSGT